MVFVNTVVVVRGALGGGEREVAWALAAFGAGSMLVALMLPRVLDRVPDRRVMLTAALAMTVLLACVAAVWTVRDGAIAWAQLITAWALLGMAYAGLVTPGGRLLRRSARTEHLPQLFAAQFSLSHACWLVAYPLAGWMGAKFGLDAALMALTVLCVLGAMFAWRAWRADDAAVLAHEHPDLPPDHPHWAEHADVNSGAAQHAHAYVIDDLHRRWPG